MDTVWKQESQKSISQKLRKKKSNLKPMNNQKSQVNNKKRNQKRKTINDIDSCFTIKTIIIATEFINKFKIIIQYY